MFCQNRTNECSFQKLCICFNNKLLAKFVLTRLSSSDSIDDFENEFEDEFDDDLNLEEE